MDYKEVDLGIEIDGKKLIFADRNVGANSVTDYGEYFAWGEITPKITGYSWKDYKFSTSCDDTTFTKYNNIDKITTLELDDDAAHVNMGGDWRMPTERELLFLNIFTDKYWVENYQESGVNGIKYIGKNHLNNELFIPVSGFISNSKQNGFNMYGDIWSSTLAPIDTAAAWFLDFGYNENGRLSYYFYRHLGFSVRGVKLV